MIHKVSKFERYECLGNLYKVKFAIFGENANKYDSFFKQKFVAPPKKICCSPAPKPRRLYEKGLLSESNVQLIEMSSRIAVWRLFCDFHVCVDCFWFVQRILVEVSKLYLIQNLNRKVFEIPSNGIWIEWHPSCQRVENLAGAMTYFISFWSCCCGV